MNKEIEASERKEIDRLVSKSIEAFIVGIELFNKPTIQYRVEGFAFFICNAWELMLKAQMILTQGEKSIFYPESTRTISIGDCIKKVFTNNKDPLRLNLEKIQELRNQSTHYITDEYEYIYVPLFQSCVFNYVDKLKEFHEKDIIDYINYGFLTLVSLTRDLNESKIRAKYDQETARRILETQEEIENLRSENNSNFSYGVDFNLYVTKKIDEADTKVRIAADGEVPVKIIKERKNPVDTHPLSTNQCLAQINKRIEREKIEFSHLFDEKKSSYRHNFTSGDFQLFSKFYDIKSNEAYCFEHSYGTTKSYSYSQSVVEFIVGEIRRNPATIITHLKTEIKKVNPRSKGF